MAEKLKPCPFCGRAAELRTEPLFQHCIRRKGCGAFIDAWSRSAEDAIATWNRRSQEEVK